MESLFITVLNMSFTGSILIVFVLITRLLLKKAPKIYSYLLWLVPMFRLICPFSIESAYSLIPANPQPIPTDIGLSAAPHINTGIAALNSNINASLPVPDAACSVNPLQILLAIGCLVWIAGIALITVYTLASYIKLKITLLSHSTNTEKNIYTCSKTDIPFVMGIFNPKIYLPANLDNAEREFIILHEKTHIKRLDYIVKFIGWLIRTLHWFNPLIWLAYSLMEKDMEMSCDETVIAKADADIKQAYSGTLLHFSALKSRNRLPVAFGNTNIKDRIKNILSFKKPPVIIAGLLIISVVVFGLACMLSPKQTPIDTPVDTLEQVISSKYTESDFYALIADEANITVIRKEDFTDWLNTVDLSEIEKPPHIDELTSDFIIYAADNEFKIYSDCTMSAKLDNCLHYYTISKDNYDQLFFYYAIRSNVYPYGSKQQPDNYIYTGDDPLLRLAYATEMSIIPDEGFKVASIKLFNYSLEDNKLKIFVIVYEETYKVNENEVILAGGSVRCKAITFTGSTVQKNGLIDINNFTSYPAQIVNASDGSYWKSSIEQFCTTPVTNKKIQGLADKITAYYSDYTELQQMQREHLVQTLNESGFKDMYLATEYDNSREKLN